MSTSVFRSVFSNILSRTARFAAVASRSLLLAGGIAAASAGGAAHANPKYAGIVIDAKTGKVLYSEDADEQRYPASLTKMMTIYLAFEALEAGKISKNTLVPVSKNAAMEPPSKLGVRPGSKLTVEQAIQALVTRSANDVATALGEFLGGSEDRFARMMTQKARALGMTRTVYRNAHGLPNTAQVTTARDQARLGLALRQHFPQYYDYFGTRSFRYGKQTIGNHNRLLGVVRGVDGIKTGYTRASGFNLVTSAQADGRSVVGVVLGGRTGAARDQQMRKLIASYMPAASRRGSGNLIAETREAPTLSTAAAANPVAANVAPATENTRRVELPENGPVPSYRYEESRIEMAYAATSVASASNLVGKEALAATLRIQRNVTDPAAAPQADVDQGDADPAVDALTTASTAAPADKSIPSGWVIQIGATPDRGQAQALLARAKDQGGKALRNAEPFTVAFANDGAQLYRARFGGFSGQDSAVNACKTLKKKGFSCWASQQ